MQMDHERGWDLHAFSNGIRLAVASNSLVLSGQAHVQRHIGAVGDASRSLSTPGRSMEPMAEPRYTAAFSQIAGRGAPGLPGQRLPVTAHL